MFKLRKITAISCLMILTTSCSTVASSNDEIKKVNNDGFEKIIRLDNDAVLVVEMKFAPGASSPLHSHIYSCRLVYAIQGGTMELTPQFGEPHRSELTVGKTIWRLVPEPETHTVKNIGQTEVRVIEVEFKHRINCG